MVFLDMKDGETASVADGVFGLERREEKIASVGDGVSGLDYAEKSWVWSRQSR
jgi:hypothetical protein